MIGGFVAASIPAWDTNLVFAAVFGVFALFEADPRREAKKKLVITQRARRIFALSLFLNVLSGGVLLFYPFALLAILAVQLIPFLLVISNILLFPVEERIQRKIMHEARTRLAKINPHIIGITGSFGKTSVKHILGHILGMNAPTLFTPGSVNTLMGISRIIREELASDCRYFIVEMGAYGEGSIQKLCALTPPQTGIITAIGEAHYERFKTLETVARAKFELAAAVLKHTAGCVIVHENVLAEPYAADFVHKQRTHFVICGQGVETNLRIEDVVQTNTGLTLRAHLNGADYSLAAPLFGMHHAGNIALAFATAVTLGIAPERAVAALRSVPQIQHRLEVKLQPNGSLYIDDAYNSNPAGFAAAVELMTTLAGGKKRRVLVTPGLVELGDRHDAVHEMLGATAAKNTDVVLAVKPERIQAFVNGFAAAKSRGVLYPAANLAEAQKWLTENSNADDIVLIENDLPDVHERKLVV